MNRQYWLSLNWLIKAHSGEKNMGSKRTSRIPLKGRIERHVVRHTNISFTTEQCSKKRMSSTLWLIRFSLTRLISRWRSTTKRTHKADDLPGTWIRRTTRKIPVLKRRENRLQLAIIFDGRRSAVRNVEWYQDMLPSASEQSQIDSTNDRKQLGQMFIWLLSYFYMSLPVLFCAFI